MEQYSNNKLKNPIYFETPRLRKFYEKNLSNIEETVPINQIKSIMISPNTPNTRNKSKLTNFNSAQTDDLFMNALISTPQLSKEICNIIDSPQHKTTKKTNNETISKVKVSQEKTQNSKYIKEKIPDLCDKIIDIKKKETKKRKRKSDDQLKILKWELENDGFCNKDKFINIAQSTGLTESQVYKWCWDQKKKTLETLLKNKSLSESEQKILIEKFSDWKQTMKCNIEESYNQSQLKQKRGIKALQAKLCQDGQENHEIQEPSISKKLQF